LTNEAMNKENDDDEFTETLELDKLEPNTKVK
jgi:hypothetical protein